MSDYLSVLVLFVYGSWEFISPVVLQDQTWINALFSPGTDANRMATAIAGLANAVFNPLRSLQEPTDFFTTVVAPVYQLNNGVDTGCSAQASFTGPYASCLSIPLTPFLPEPSGPILAPLPLNQTVNVNTPLLCTYAPTDFINSNPAGTCNCAVNNYGHSPSCTLYCDPPSYPILVGALPQSCLWPGSCTSSTGLDFPSYTSIQNAMTANVTGPDNRVGVGIMPLSNTPLWYKNFLAAALSVAYIRRNNPYQFMYFRTLGDPLFGANCFPNATNQQLWGGVNVEVFLRVLNVTYFGDLLTNYTSCTSMYASTDPAFQVCANLQYLYPWESGTAWGQQFATSFLPALQLLMQYQGNCTLGNQCFVFTTFAGSAILTSLPGSVFVPGTLELPPLQLVAPEFAGLPVGYTLQTVPKCTSTPLPPSTADGLWQAL